MKKELSQNFKISQKELLAHIDFLLEDCPMEIYPEILSIFIIHIQKRNGNKNLVKGLKRSRMKLIDELEKEGDDGIRDLFLSDRRKRRKQPDNSYLFNFRTESEEFDF